MKWSLTMIRNKLVHGEVFPDYKLEALQVATQHLQWTLERLILSYFGWSINKSNVSSRFLSHVFTAYEVMDTQRKIISS